MFQTTNQMVYPLAITNRAVENHHAINGNLHYFHWVMFNSYVLLAEGSCQSKSMTIYDELLVSN